MTMKRIHRFLLAAAATLAFAAAATAQSEWTSGTIAYDGLGNIVAMGQDVYLYDSAGRLVSGTANQQQSGATARQDYSYDAFGNRLNVTTTGTVCVGRCAPNVSVSTATNRITDNNATYDPAGAGHMTRFGASTYAYDGADMVSRVTDGTVDWQFVYTADDERLATYTGQGNWRFTVRDVDQKVLREVTAYQGTSGTTWTWDRDHVYRQGLLLATVYPSGQRQQFHVDHLGTARLVTDVNGARIGEHAYYPFGDELALNGSEWLPERLKFTGHERDTLGSDEPLDYMHARAYSPVGGRFLSVDPVLGERERPQSWNRYAYVENDPLTRTDPTGTQEVIVVTAPMDDLARMMFQANWDELNRLRLFWSAFNLAWDLHARSSRRAFDEKLNIDWRSRGFESFEQCVEEHQCVRLEDAPLPLIGGEVNEARLAMKAEDLIRGSLKASASYRSELGQKTYREIIKLAKGKGPEALAAKGMKKLIEQSARLLDKIRGGF